MPKTSKSSPLYALVRKDDLDADVGRNPKGIITYAVMLGTLQQCEEHASDRFKSWPQGSSGQQHNGYVLFRVDVVPVETWMPKTVPVENIIKTPIK